MKWEIAIADKDKVAKMAAQTGLPFALASLLIQRKIPAGRVNEFLQPKLSDLSDPFLIIDMRKAVERVWQAIDKQELIVVFGDYDVDGVSSGSLLARFLNQLGARVKSFIPDRIDEGYGLSVDAVRRCLEQFGCALIVTVDCGTNAVEGVAYAQQAGVDVIITDHHELDEIVAEAFALINPKRGSVKPLKMLAGVGVAFKFAHGILKLGREKGRPNIDHVDLKSYLDIVALGTVSDIVPLLDENRILVKHGLSQMQVSCWQGVQALMAVAGLEGELSTYNLGYQLGPRINAAGRIGKPLAALKLLTTDDAGQAHQLADELDQVNHERRKMERKMAEEAFAEIETYFNPRVHFGLVVARESWHPGVVGIVASRISRHYNRPAIVLGIDEDGVAHGSCRSVDAFDLLEGLDDCSDYLIKYGGHKMAAGVTVKADQIDSFKFAFNQAAFKRLEHVDLYPVLRIDGCLDNEQIDWGFMDQLKRLSPFGQANDAPVWVLRNIEVVGELRVIGQCHLKFMVQIGSEPLEAIAFNWSPDDVPDGPLNIAFVLKENSWRNNKTIQLQVKDIQPAEWGSLGRK